MKKNHGIVLVAIAAAVALNVSMSNQKQDKASMLVLANMEALADGEVEISLEDWWNRKDWNCKNLNCGFIIVQGPEFAGAGKGTVEHSWLCGGC